MKKIVKLLSVLTFFSLCGIQAFAQENKNGDKAIINQNAAGLAVVAPLCGGLNYQHWFDNGLGFELTGLGGYYEDSASNHYYYMADAQLQYNIFTTAQEKVFCTIFYAWLLGGATGSENDSGVFVNNALAGIGFGSEFIFWQRMSVPVEFGFSATFPESPMISVCGGIGLKFRF